MVAEKGARGDAISHGLLHRLVKPHLVRVLLLHLQFEPLHLSSKLSGSLFGSLFLNSHIWLGT